MVVCWPGKRKWATTREYALRPLLVGRIGLLRKHFYVDDRWLQFKREGRKVV